MSATLLSGIGYDVADERSLRRRERPGPSWCRRRWKTDPGRRLKLTHPGMGYSEREDLMLVAEEAVEIRVLRRQGKSIRKIARMLNLSRNTVRRYLRGEGLPQYQREPGPSKLDRYKQYLAERVKAAAPEWIPATVLLREVKALGYSG